ncbi:MAG: hypothetical protein SPI30_10965 [Prevotella sp.]|nr:hypothetical protein [Prevotella sp.]
MSVHICCLSVTLYLPVLTEGVAGYAEEERQRRCRQSTESSR